MKVLQQVLFDQRKESKYCTYSGAGIYKEIIVWTCLIDSLCLPGKVITVTQLLFLYTFTRPSIRHGNSDVVALLTHFVKVTSHPCCGVHSFRPENRTICIFNFLIAIDLFGGESMCALKWDDGNRLEVRLIAWHRTIPSSSRAIVIAWNWSGPKWKWGDCKKYKLEIWTQSLSFQYIPG